MRKPTPRHNKSNKPQSPNSKRRHPSRSAEPGAQPDCPPTRATDSAPVDPRNAAFTATEQQRSDERLRQMSERFELVAMATNDAVWDWDLGTDALWWNQGIQALFGYPLEEVAPTIAWWYEHLHPEDRERVVSSIHTVIDSGGQAWAEEHRFKRRDGSDAYVYDRGFVIRDAGGKAVRMIGAMMDITERKRTEEAMAQHALHQEMVAALGQFALGQRELDELMRRAASDIARGLGLGYCKVLEYAPAETCLLLRARVGWDAFYPMRTAHVEYKSIESYCLRHNQPVTVEDFDQERRFARCPLEQEANIRSGLAVIIHGKATSYGVLSAHSDRVRSFAPGEVNFVQSVANVLAAAIERREAEQQLAQLAQFDSLTGLPNRTLFRDRLTQAVARAQRDERLTALLFLDLDHFKEINDTLGHETGDRVLKSVSERLRGCLRQHDTIARPGGDEFTVILEELTSSAQIERVADKILQAFASPIYVDDKEFFVTPSIGVAVYPYDGKDVDNLLKHADIAMYQAKNEGRNNVQFYASTMSAAANDRMSLERSLRRALEREEFLVYYQPVVDLWSGTIIGMEALLRWRHPEWGLVAPARFLSLAEQTGLIVPIGEWVLREACTQSARWQKAGLLPVRVAVNLSARQFRKSNLVDVVAGALEGTGLRGNLLELEITESLLMENPEISGRLLERLKAMGVHVALDDFGTGYSSFAYLKHFPLDTVKIDQSFVRNVTSDPDDAAIVIGMIELAHSLELKLTAEGAETKEQTEFLRYHGCDYAQGYLFSHPLPAEELIAILQTRRIPIG